MIPQLFSRSEAISRDNWDNRDTRLAILFLDYECEVRRLALHNRDTRGRIRCRVRGCTRHCSPRGLSLAFAKLAQSSRQINFFIHSSNQARV